jgi:hypothetical protein
VSDAAEPSANPNLLKLVPIPLLSIIAFLILRFAQVAGEDLADSMK